MLNALDIDLPLKVRRLETMYLRQLPGKVQIGCCITDGNSNIAIRPDMGRDILAAAYPSQMPLATQPAEQGDQQADDEHLVRIRKSLSERLPDFIDAQPVRSVSGTYDITPDWHPVLDEVPAGSGHYLCVGFSGHGFKLGPAVGVMAADLVTGSEDRLFDIDLFRLGRFAEGDPVRGTYEHSIAG